MHIKKGVAAMEPNPPVGPKTMAINIISTISPVRLQLKAVLLIDFIISLVKSAHGQRKTHEVNSRICPHHNFSPLESFPRLGHPPLS